MAGVFKQCLEELKVDYESHMKELTSVHQKILENNDQVNQAFSG